MFYVYLICTEDQKNTYVGATTDVMRRLSQHNNEKSGGAKRTTSLAIANHTWQLVRYVEGFPQWNAALQFEWRWKQLSRQLHGFTPLEKRLMALEELMSLEKSTTKAIPFKDYPEALKIVKGHLFDG
jgi:predicted GIY-YIG superfamily endonuclease